jgi:thiamine biosynthesis lipoprotein
VSADLQAPPGPPPAADADASAAGRRYTVDRTAYGWIGRFTAMASPCEVLVAERERETAESVVAAVANEAKRVEHKFSRYLDGNAVHRINNAGGAAVTVDDETEKLLRYAAALYRLSDGLFDITSGILRRAWRFDGSDRVPTPAAVRDLLGSVGWYRVRFEPPQLSMPAGMEIDFGGIGKEYAVDRAASLASRISTRCLINFGGDLLALGPAAGGRPWRVGIERVDVIESSDCEIELTIGAIATSGDSRRFLLKDGQRYGHVLDPRTGWPVQGAPRSVTVAAPTCSQAGMLATFALLQGSQAENFLQRQNIRYWCRR